MAAGAGAWLVVVTTVLIVLSLGPLSWLIARLRAGQAAPIPAPGPSRPPRGRRRDLRALTQKKNEIVSVSTQRLGKGRYGIDLDLKPPPAMKDESIIGSDLGGARHGDPGGRPTDRVTDRREHRSRLDRLDNQRLAEPNRYERRVRRVTGLLRARRRCAPRLHATGRRVPADLMPPPRRAPPG